MGGVLSTRHRLWLGPDHILSVSNHGYSEEYKRFYFGHIHSIVIRQTAKGAVVTSLLAAVVLLFMLLSGIGMGFRWPSGGVITLAVVASFFGLVLAIHAARGPTCVCHIRTAVQTEQLFSLHRVPTARKALRAIREAVEAVQGTLAVEDLEAGLAERRGTPPAAARTQVAPAVRMYQTKAHAVLFSVLLADAAHTAVNCFVQSKTLYVLGIAILIAMTLSLLFALIRQAGTDLSRGLKMTTWYAAGYLFVSFMIGNMIAAFMAAQRGAAMPQTNMEDFWRPWLLSPMDSTPMMVLTVFMTICSGGLGLAGWLQLQRFHKENRLPPDLPGNPPPQPGASAPL